MSLVKHRDVFGKPLGRLFYIIGKTFFYFMKKKTIMMPSVNHHNASGKPSYTLYQTM
jgi:hypothetical protein